MPSPRAVSVDVFDTVVTRRVIHPHHAFTLIGRRVERLTNVTPAAFTLTRVAAEADLRHASAGAEVRLEEIAQEVARRLQKPGIELDLASIELEVERALIVAVPHIQPWLDRYRREFGSITFISDIYLPEAFLRDVLDQVGVLHAGDQLFCSSSTGDTKATGSLFERVLEDLAIPPTALLHIGDNPWSDVRVPDSLGIQTRRFDHITPTAREELEPDVVTASDGIASLLRGASRLARLTTPVTSRHDQTIRDVAADVTAPFTAAYVLWCLEQARRLDLDHLLFISRDGWRMLQIATHLSTEREGRAATRCDYLVGGRAVWQLPSILDRDDIGTSQILAFHGEPNRAALRDRLGFVPDRLNDDRSAPVTADLLADLEADLRGSEWPKVEAAARHRRAQIKQQLLDLGLTEHARVGLVDIGWSGRTGVAAQRLFQALGFPRPECLYAAYRQTPDTKRPDGHHVMFHPRGDSTDALQGLEDLVEALLCPAQGTARFAADGAVTQDVPEAAELAEWGASVADDTTEHYASALRSSLDAVALHTSDLPASLLAEWFAADIRDLRDAPTPREAAVWGAFPHHPDQDAAVRPVLAPPLTLEASLPQSIRRLAGRPAWTTRWYAASLAQATPVTQSIVRARASRAYNRVRRTGGPLLTAALHKATEALSVVRAAPDHPKPGGSADG